MLQALLQQIGQDNPQLLQVNVHTHSQHRSYYYSWPIECCDTLETQWHAMHTIRFTLDDTQHMMGVLLSNTITTLINDHSTTIFSRLCSHGSAYINPVSSSGEFLSGVNCSISLYEY